MSNIPSTSLVINPEGVETIAGRIPDVIYLMAPAIKGGEKLNDIGLPILDQNRNCVMTSKVFSRRYSFEKEFGRARDGSWASVYATWIYDLGSYAIRCRRVLGPNVAFATATIEDAQNTSILNVRSFGQSEWYNNTIIDIDDSTNREAYLTKANAVFDTVLGQLQVVQTYTANDRLIFDGRRGLVAGGDDFRLAFFGDGETKNFGLFEFGAIDADAGVPFVVTDGQYTFTYTNDPAQVVEGTDYFTYNATTKQLTFAKAPCAGHYNLLIKGTAGFGDFDLTMHGDGVKTVFSLDFTPFSNIVFKALYVNGIGAQFDQKNIRLVRLYTESQYVALKGVKLKVSVGTNGVGYSKIELTCGRGANLRYEKYDNMRTLKEITEEINSKSNLVRAEGMASDLNQVPSPCEEHEFRPIGVMLTIRNESASGQIVEKFDDMRDADSIVQKVNGTVNGSRLVVMEVIGAYGAHTPAVSYQAGLVVSVQLKGGASGQDADTIDYLDALSEAETSLDVTVVIAPGVSDAAFHDLMNSHCHTMSKRGYYRTCAVGGAAGETIEQKIARTRMLNSERLCMIGTGVAMIDPRGDLVLERGTMVRKVQKTVFPPSVAVVPFVAQLVSQPFWVCQTYKYLMNAYGVDVEYDDAQHQELHEHKVVTFRINNGVQIVDAITTSQWNAYEDIHTVRTFDVVSRGVNKAMLMAIGKSNLPPTWAYVTGLIRRFLESLRNTNAIMDFSILNETMPQDLVDRRFKIRIGLIPVFPIKYVEGEIDIMPPLAMPSM